MTPHSDHALVYVCIISNFNQPELEACLTRKPADILLIVSSSMAKSADRFVRVLRDLCPESNIHRSDELGKHLQAENVEECQKWVTEVLKPFLLSDKFLGKSFRLNFTGGTKALVAALLTGYHWDGLDYKAVGKNELQTMQYQPGEGFKNFDTQKIVDALPSAIAKLHEENVTVASPNPLQDINLAQDIWVALEGGEAALRNLFNAFDKIWSQERDNPEWKQHHTLTFAMDEFLGHEADSNEINWLNRFNQLAPEGIYINDNQITLPGNNRKSKGDAKNLRGWLSGDWLEQLACHWLISAGLPERAMQANLKGAKDDKDFYQREADILVNYRGNARLIEIKADFPPGNNTASVEQQLLSLGDRFGRTTKVLLIGPDGQRKFKNRDINQETFAKRCRLGGIQLVLNRDDLIKLIGLS